MNNSIVITIDLSLALLAGLLPLTLIRAKRRKGFLLFCAFGMCVLQAAIADLLFHLFADAWAVRFFYELQLHITAFAVVFLFLFVLRYCNIGEDVSPSARYLLFFLPALMAALSLTGPGYMLFYRRVYVLTLLDPRVIEVEPGLWFWVQAAFCLLLLTGTLAVLLYRIRSISRIYRGPLYLMAGGVALAAGCLFMSVLSPSTRPNVALLGLSAAMALLYVAMSVGGQAGFLMLARSEAFNYLNDNIFILNNEFQVMEANKAARAWMKELGVEEEHPEFRKIMALLKTIDLVPGQCAEDGDGAEAYIAKSPGRSVYQIREFPAVDEYGKQMGLIITLTDVTWYRKLVGRMESIMGIDPMTGLGNRFSYQQRCAELETPEHLPVSVVVGDVNNLKRVNDRYGHAQGDRLLQACARAMYIVFTYRGQIYRIGGDEFVALLPATSYEEALALCERVQEELGKTRDLPEPPAMALGCETKTSPGQSIEEVFASADFSMYANKKNNRRKGPADRRQPTAPQEEPEG